jgi:hypothetical protein
MFYWSSFSKGGHVGGFHPQTHVHLFFYSRSTDGNTTALQRHYTENAKQILPEMKLRGLVLDSYIHVSVSDFYIPTIGMPILLHENRWTYQGNI